jgi:dihydroxyacetone kinase-like protein
MPIGTAAEMASLMVDRIIADEPADAGTEIAVLISGLGATPLMELYLLYGHVDRLLRARGLNVARRLVGNYFTSLEMLGVSLTVMWLNPDLDRWMGRPARSVGLTVTENS